MFGKIVIAVIYALHVFAAHQFCCAVIHSIEKEIVDQRITQEAKNDGMYHNWNAPVFKIDEKSERNKGKLGIKYWKSDGKIGWSVFLGVHCRKDYSPQMF